jgi:hypothetical protein
VANSRDIKSADLTHGMLEIPSAKLARDMFNSPSAKLALDTFNGPSAKLARDMFNSPSAKLAQDMFNGPSAKLALDMFNSPSAKLAQDMFNGPSAKLALDMFNSPSAKLAQDMFKSPAAKLALDMFNSPSAKLAQEMFKSPSAKLARDMFSPSAKLALDIFSSPSAKLARDMFDSPLARAARQMLDSKSLRFSTWNSPASKIAQALLLNPSHTSQFLQSGRFLSGISVDAFASSLLAERAVSIARAQGHISDVRGHSLALDALASLEFDPGMSEADFQEAALSYLDHLALAIRSYLPGVQSLPSLLGHAQQIVTLLATILCAYYASQSATTSDIDALKGVVEQQTQATQQASARIEGKFQEVLTLAEQLVQGRLTQIAPRKLYIAQRSVPAKATKSMKAPITGIVAGGSVVAVLSFDKKWMEVEFFDFMSGSANRGWVTKKNFRGQK